MIEFLLDKDGNKVDVSNIIENYVFTVTRTIQLDQYEPYTVTNSITIRGDCGLDKHQISEVGMQTVKDNVNKEIKKALDYKQQLKEATK